MQTILGANGTIGQELAKELLKYTSEIRLVSRNPKKVNDSDQLVKADLCNKEQTEAAIAGSEIVYLTVGLEYSTEVWQRDWPRIMNNVVAACRKYKAKLVFFDNVYMYDVNEIKHMTEQSSLNPISKKGKVRAELIEMLFAEVANGGFQVLVARAADFYGPNNEKSLLIETVYKNLKAGKAAIWFADASKVHSFTYTPDAAKATAMLGNCPEAYNQVWHLPTCHERLTGKKWIELVAEELKVAPKYSLMPKWSFSVLGLFMPFMKEMSEMLYQYDRDYFFDSRKFEDAFSYTPISYREGIKEIINSDKK